MELRGFIIGLNKAASLSSLKMVMVRAYQGLPSVKVGSDIDFIVKDEELEGWLRLISGFCYTHKLTLETTKKYSYCTKLVIFGIEGELAGLEIDLNNSFCWRGVDFYSSEIYIDQAVPVNKVISSCGDVLNYYITFCHGFLYGGLVRDKYVDDYKSLLLIKEKREEFYSYLVVIMSKSDSMEIIESLCSGDLKRLGESTRAIRIRVLLNSLIKNPKYSMIQFIRSYYYDIWK
jgi:hypothetical protein